MARQEQEGFRNMTWQHYDKRELTMLDTAWQYEQEVWFKPRGLWLSDGDEWKQWCESEDFHLDEITHRHEIVLADGWDILTLGTEQELRDFTKEYGKELLPGLSMQYIDWARVVDDYDGVIFSPYHWHLRFDMDIFWYNTIDVSSACIWNVEAIESIRYVP
jgi:hypothetical protein